MLRSYSRGGVLSVGMVSVMMMVVTPGSVPGLGHVLGLDLGAGEAVQVVDRGGVAVHHGAAQHGGALVAGGHPEVGPLGEVFSRLGQRSPYPRVKASP